MLKKMLVKRIDGKGPEEMRISPIHVYFIDGKKMHSLFSRDNFQIVIWFCEMETQATNNEVRRHIRPTNVLFNGFLWSYLCCTPGRNYFNIKPSVNFYAPGTHPLSVRWTDKPATWTATTEEYGNGHPTQVPEQVPFSVV